MPLYDYQCRDCGEVFEIRATFKQKEEGLHPNCPSCESKKTEQVVSAPMVIRAGAGDGASLAPFACSPNAGPGCC
jgi:putative FmdB family regulatory protein